MGIVYKIMIMSMLDFSYDPRQANIQRVRRHNYRILHTGTTPA